MSGLVAGDVACWVLKTTLPPEAIVAGWRPGDEEALRRCVRSSYRLDLMAAGQPVLLWVSGRDRPGVHALGVVAGTVTTDADAPVVPVRLTRLAEPVARAELLANPAVRDAEVLRMPAGSNPSWLSARQFAALLARVRDGHTPAGLGPWSP
ncbi:MAG TPA: hypothetical protein VGN28_11085 [Blastococcus sp.]|nr:hypothetical protein [Blastococcus sp.]